MIVRLNLEGSQFTRRRQSSLALRWTERLFVTAGILGIGYYSYVFADSWYFQRYEDWALSRNLHGQEASQGDYLKHVLSSNDPEDEAVIPAGDSKHPATAVGKQGKVEPNRQDRSLIGRIEIPRVQVSAIVREGVDSRTLRRAVGHVPGTALPGKPGNIGLAGHRDSFFTGLRGIRKSDRIQLHTLDGDFSYEVDSIRIVTPKDVEVLAPTAEPSLTLVTCYPFNYVGSAPKRYIVRAKQVQPAPGDVVEAKEGGEVEAGASPSGGKSSGSGTGEERRRGGKRVKVHTS